MHDLNWTTNRAEGPFFERKSCYERSGDRPRRRPVRDVARDVAETLVAMANADGGALALGVEDDGVVSGVDFPDDRLAVLHQLGQTHVRPPLKPKITLAELQGQTIWLYEVDWSPDVHQLSDGRYLLRIGDSNVPFPADQIDAIKAGKRRRIAEARYVPDAAIGDLDLGLLDELRERSGWNLPDEHLLERFRLAEPRDGRLALTLAALLLFGRDPGRWHPRCGIDFIKHEGTERRFGADLNIVKRVRLEAPLVRLIEQSYGAIEPHIRERQRLVDLFFEERMEYPPFAWQEAIVNAVAHRDYGYEGLGTEIWMFDNRIEVRSPGQLVEPVTLERLLRRERIHASRNPRLVRVLTEWGYMREQGEGVPRMYEAMEAEGLYPPNFQIEADVIFAVILRNEPVYSPETRRWLKQYDGLGLTGDQKRLLAYAKEHDGTFTSQAYQRLASVDIYQASKDIKDLIRKDLVQLPNKGGRVYELRQAERTSALEPPPEYRVLLPILEGQGFVRNRDIRDALGVSSLKANRIAKALEATGWLRREGNRRGTRYLAVRD